MSSSEGDPSPAIKAGTGMVLSMTRGTAQQRKKPPGGGAFGGGGTHSNGAASLFGGADDGEEEPKAQFITSLDDGKKEAVTKAPLVIQVSEPRWRRQAPPVQKTAPEGAEGTAKSVSLDQLAADQLAREARGEVGDTDDAEKMGTRIIHLSNGHGGDDDAPMLVRNAVPIPKELVDDKERLKYELSLREDDIDPSSDVYKMVPVEEFGAALLRGMGWKGPSEDDVKVHEVRARPEGLGLGADPAVLELDAQGKKKRKGMKHDSEKAKAALAKAVEDRIKKQVLKVADVVRIKEGSLAGKRAVVTKTDGVGGIQMIEVEVEAVGGLTRVKMTDVFKVASQELSDDPFVKASSSSSSPRGNGNGSKRSAGGRDEHKQRSRSASREKKRKKKDSKRSRSRSRDRDEGGSRKAKKRTTEDSASSSSRPRDGGPSGSNRDWLVPKIRVRVITEKGVGAQKQSFYRRTGVVIDVPRPSEATVRMDSGDVLEGMKARHLETALPGVQGIVVVLRGRHRLRKGKLLEKDRDAEEGKVELLRDRTVLRISLDDIAEYRGGEDDMDED